MANEAIAETTGGSGKPKVGETLTSELYPAIQEYKATTSSFSDAKRSIQPVSIAGIEFDALIESSRAMNSEVPAYPVEKGYPVSDNIITQPFELTMTLYVTATPVTWAGRKKHETDFSRVESVCSEIQSLWESRKLVKIVTNDAIYTNMALTSITIKKSKDLGYAREISITAKKVTVTAKKKEKIPSYSKKSGKTKSNNGSASKKNKSTGKKKDKSRKSSSSSSSKKAKTQKSKTSKSPSSSKKSNGKKKQKKSSILHKVAKRSGII